MKGIDIENKKPNVMIHIINDWWSWLLLGAVGIAIFYIRTWNLHFLIKIGILFAFSLIMVIDMGRKEYSVEEILSDDDIEEQFIENQSKIN